MSGGDSAAIATDARTVGVAFGHGPVTLAFFDTIAADPVSTLRLDGAREASLKLTPDGKHALVAAVAHGGHTTTIYELDSPDAITTPEFRAMRGWYQFAPHVRSRTQVIVPVQGR